MEVLLTENIRHWIRTVLLTSDLPNETRDELRKYSGGVRRSSATASSAEDGKRPRTIPFQLIQSVYDMQLVKGVYLHELLQGSDIHLKELVTPPRNPELEARIQRLKTQQDQRQYDKMTSNVVNQRNKSDDESFSKQMREVNRQIISVFNFILTVGGSFAFAFKAIEYAMEKPNFVVQLCGGLLVAGLVFIADMYFLIKYSA